MLKLFHQYYWCKIIWKYWCQYIDGAFSVDIFCANFQILCVCMWHQSTFCTNFTFLFDVRKSTSSWLHPRRKKFPLERIDLYRIFPALWKVKSKDYSDRNKKRYCLWASSSQTLLVLEDRMSHSSCNDIVQPNSALCWNHFPPIFASLLV